jgi:hypothetical protein
MNLNALYPEDYFKITIKWNKPVPYEEILEQDYEEQEDLYFYKIIAQFGNKEPKLIYIGKAYKQHVRTRLRNKDHKIKRKTVQEQYKRHIIYVSTGKVIEHNSSLKSSYVDKVESLLIFAHAHNDFPHLLNSMSVWNHNIKKAHHIINKGYLKDGMEKEIALGVFVK